MLGKTFVGAVMATDSHALKLKTFSVLTRYAAPQNQERPGRSGEAEGVRRHPPTLRQGDESMTKGHLWL